MFIFVWVFDIVDTLFNPIFEYVGAQIIGAKKPQISTLVLLTYHWRYAPGAGAATFLVLDCPYLYFFLDLFANKNARFL